MQILGLKASEKIRLVFVVPNDKYDAFKSQKILSEEEAQEEEAKSLAEVEAKEAKDKELAKENKIEKDLDLLLADKLTEGMQEARKLDVEPEQKLIKKKGRKGKKEQISRPTKKAKLTELDLAHSILHPDSPDLSLRETGAKTEADLGLSDVQTSKKSKKKGRRSHSDYTKENVEQYVVGLEYARFAKRNLPRLEASFLSHHQICTL